MAFLQEINYIEPPTIPAGMTVSEYKRQRPPVKRVWIVAMTEEHIFGQEVRGRVSDALGRCVEHWDVDGPQYILQEAVRSVATGRPVLNRLTATC